jgi:class 3 adenylate cyclase/pimeloyl-ACP methyl ester carboxylesterase
MILSMMQRRKAGYALTRDGYHIAYADLGQGDLCHVFMAHGASLVDDVQRQHPAHVRFERLCASLGRLVLVDARGFGVSDVAPLDGCFAPEAWATDILAVLDALGIERAVISGEGFSGHAATQFAVTHPERTLRLALNNSYARLARAEGYEIGAFSMDRVAHLVSAIEREWGTGRPTADGAPSLATDPSFLDYNAARERRTASPGTMGAWGRAMATSDIRELLPRVTVPTLVYFTGDLVTFPVEHSRYLATHIPGAILVEAPGRSFYLPSETERLTAWAEFIVGGRAALSHEDKLLTLLFTDVVGSTRKAAELGDTRWARVVGDLDAFVAQRVELHGGRVVKQTGDGHLIAFDLPRHALRAAREITLGVHVLGVEVRCGLHVGEVELLPDGDLGGIAVHTAARVCDAAGPRQVLVSRTVADLAAGSDFRFEDRGAHELRGVPGSWTLYEVMTS